MTPYSACLKNTFNRQELSGLKDFNKDFDIAAIAIYPIVSPLFCYLSILALFYNC